MEIEDLIRRKLLATFCTTIVTALFFTIWISWEEKSASGFIGWFLLYSLYVGGVVLLYGNLVSFGIEYIQKKGYFKQTWLYIALYGLFGLALGLLFQNITLAVTGMIVALLYVFIDHVVGKIG